MKYPIKIVGLILLILGFYPFILSAQEMPLGRIHKWKSQGQIKVFLLGSPIREFKIEDKVYRINVHDIFKSALSDVNREILFTPAVPFSLVEWVEEADLFLGLYNDSFYLKAVQGSQRGRTLLNLIRTHPGITLIVDKEWKLWGLDPTYEDDQYDYLECLVAHPQFLIFGLPGITVVGYHKVLEFKDPVEKIKLAMIAITKHELYHALGLTHQAGCHFGEKNSTCSVMASDSKLLWLYPTPSEMVTIEKIWK